MQYGWPTGHVAPSQSLARAHSTSSTRCTHRGTKCSSHVKEGTCKHHCLTWSRHITHAFNGVRLCRAHLRDQDVAHAEHAQAANLLGRVEDDRREAARHLAVQPDLDALRRTTPASSNMSCSAANGSRPLAWCARPRVHTKVLTRCAAGAQATKQVHCTLCMLLLKIQGRLPASNLHCGVHVCHNQAQQR